MNTHEWATRLAVIGAVKRYVTDLEAETKAEAAPAFKPGDRITATTEDGTVVGTVSMTKGSPSSWKVTTPSLFKEWVRKHRPSALYTEEKVRESDQRSILDQIEKDGLVPDGVTFEPGAPGSLSVRPDHEVVRTLDWRRYLELEAAPETPVVTGDVVEARIEMPRFDAQQTITAAQQGGSDPLEVLVFEALGYASVCWSEGTRGVFMSERAADAGRQVVAAIRQQQLTQAPAAPDEDDRCGIEASWPGASHGHRCAKDGDHPGARHRCECGAEWALKPPPDLPPLAEINAAQGDAAQTGGE